MDEKEVEGLVVDIGVVDVLLDEVEALVFEI